MNASPIALYGGDFAADPHGWYEHMRATYGPLVPVELSPGVPATLVIGYEAARTILTDPLRFPADPRAWQAHIPQSCPVRPMMEWRPNALRSSGPAHDRYRAANVDAIAPIDQHALRGLVETIADGVIKDFAGSGRADLLTQFAWVVAFRVLSALLECPDDVGARIADGMAKIFEASNAEQGNQILGHAVAELVALRRQYPGDGTTSRLLRHAANLNDEEMAHQLVTLYGAGIEPLTNLISNTTRLLLVDDELAGSIHTGHATVRDALDAVLYRDPPLAAYCITYPPVPTDLGGYVLPAHQPVVVSMAACNNDPVMAGHGVVGNRAHLSWGTGPHACPARPHAYLIAETAITYLLDALPELDLAVPVAELRWRPGPFHRALEELPVRFPAVTR